MAGFGCTRRVNVIITANAIQVFITYVGEFLGLEEEAG
jgi:hypothetical protein